MKRLIPPTGLWMKIEQGPEVSFPMNEATYSLPQAVAKDLDVSPATLRRWSDEFADYLSQSADSDQGRSHRRYSEQDITTLTMVKELMNNGMTYEQVRQQLAQQPGRSGEPPVPVVSPSELGHHFDENQETALVAANGADSPAIAFLTNTLMALSDGQKSILNSQAANRELLGVLLQDNFNLKEENNRLRDRILEVEREVAQTRQDEEWRRESLRQELEGKIAVASQLATQALTTASSIELPEIKTVENKSGCLGMLFGGGTSQIVTTPKRPKPGAAPRPTAPGSAPTAANHPKPLFPPE